MRFECGPVMGDTRAVKLNLLKLFEEMPPVERLIAVNWFITDGGKIVEVRKFGHKVEADATERQQ